MFFYHSRKNIWILFFFSSLVSISSNIRKFSRTNTSCVTQPLLYSGINILAFFRNFLESCIFLDYIRSIKIEEFLLFLLSIFKLHRFFQIFVKFPKFRKYKMTRIKGAENFRILKRFKNISNERPKGGPSLQITQKIYFVNLNNLKLLLSSV